MALWLLLFACVGENVVRQPLGIPGETTGGGGGGGCSMTGQWSLNKFECGNFDFTGDFFEEFSVAQLEITQNPIVGCDVVFRWQQQGVCEETELWTMSDPLDGVISVQHDGVDSCNPPGCSFGGDDGACTIGERTGVATVDLVSNEGGALVLRNALQHAWPNCVLEDVTTWQ